MSSKGIYNQTYFINHPQESQKPAVLYVVALINTSTFQRQGIKIGITKGTSFKNVVKRSMGFKGYQIRVQRVVKDTLQQIYNLQQYLHQRFSQFNIRTAKKFGGHTQVFQQSILSQVLKYLNQYYPQYK